MIFDHMQNEMIFYQMIFDHIQHAIIFCHRQNMIRWHEGRWNGSHLPEGPPPAWAMRESGSQTGRRTQVLNCHVVTAAFSTGPLHCGVLIGQTQMLLRTLKMGLTATYVPYPGSMVNMCNGHWLSLLPMLPSWM